jgi:hypothetical protein
MKLVIATPVRGNGLAANVSVGYSESLRALSRKLPVETISATVTFAADVVRARNRLVAMALREWPDMTHVLHWDDDMWPEDLGLIEKMIACDEDFVAAPYTNKREPVRWIHQYIPFEDKGLDARGLLEVKGCGMGLTLTSRACLERVSASAKKYTDAPTENLVANVFGMLFDTIDGKEVLMSEDFSFCKRWRDVGGKIYVYGANGNFVSHVGAKEWGARDIPGGVR